MKLFKNWEKSRMVEWKKLEEIAILQKTRNRLHITENAYSITQAGLVPTKSFFKEKTNITSSDTSGYYIVKKDWFVYSPSRIDVGSINYLKDDGPVIVSPIDVVFSINTNICLPSYLLSYFFTHEGMKKLLRNREGVEGTGRRSLPFSAIKSMTIPIPSLSEQTRIVGLLDTFTNSIENLKKQIEQRRKQYEYYRDQLLDLEGKEGVEMKCLKELCEKTHNIKWKNESKENIYLYIDLSSVDIETHRILQLTNINKENAPSRAQQIVKKGDILLGTTRPTLKRYTLVPSNLDGQICSTGYCIYRAKSVIISNRWLYYNIGKTDFWKYCEINQQGAGYPCLSNTDAFAYMIPVPSIEVQNRIVSILDQFEASIANLEQQRELRQKQYEYYRNKLLTFE